MMKCWMTFCKIISFIENALFPVDKKLASGNAIANPTGQHIDGFGLFLFANVVVNTSCSAVISLDGGRWLGMTTEFSRHAHKKGGHVSLPLRNRAASLASEALERNPFKIWVWT
jgi:hypothetical protein